MSKSRLMALAGPLTILVGGLWLVASFGDLAFQTGLARDEGLLGFIFIPFFFSFVPLLFALIGARLRFHPSAGRLGRLGLALSVAGCAGTLVAVLASFVFAGVPLDAGLGPWLNYTAVAFFLSIRLGYLLFGLEALRTRPLPRWNLLPLLLGATVVLSLPLVWFGVPALVPVKWASAFLHFGLTGACWVLLGLAMLDPRRQPQPAVASSHHAAMG